MFSIMNFFRDISRYKKAMWLSLALFIGGILIGSVNSEAIRMMVLPSLEQLQGVSNQLSNSSNPELSFFTFIFLNNAIKSLLMIFLGALFGIVPIIFLVMNGMVLGFLVTAAAAQGQNMVDLIVRGLLPHGIIEIPAIIIAAGFGIQLGYLLIKSLGELGARDAADRTVVWKSYFQTLGRSAVWVTILLFIAAIIESTLTFYLVSL